MNRLPWILCLTFSFLTNNLYADDSADIAAAMQQFATEMQQEDGYEAPAAMAILNTFQYQQDVIDKISHPTEQISWEHYQNIFLTEKRIARGVQFWQNYQTVLAQAELDYGVPASIILAILGVETFYGENQGRYKVLDALATLAFYYPARAKFFRSELKQFLLLAKEQNLDIATTYGSYAGAIGYPQFMPSSYRKFAIDYANSGSINLAENAINAIGSVANYLAKAGWQAAQPITTSIMLHSFLDFSGMLPTTIDKYWPVHRWQQLGLIPEQQLHVNTLAALIQLDSFQEPWWLGLPNFYVITRYNNSKNYAMVVYRLSRHLEENWQESLKTQTLALNTCSALYSFCWQSLI